MFLEEGYEKTLGTQINHSQSLFSHTKSGFKSYLIDNWNTYETSKILNEWRVEMNKRIKKILFWELGLIYYEEGDLWASYRKNSKIFIST